MIHQKTRIDPQVITIWKMVHLGGV